MSRNRRQAGSAVLFAAAVLLAFCSVGFELTIARALTSLTHDAVTSQCITLGTYLFSLGAGTFLFSRLRNRDPWNTLFYVESGLAAAGVLSILLIFLLFSLFQIYFGISAQRLISPAGKNLILIFSAQLGTGMIGFLSGFEIPLLTSLMRQRTGRPSASRILAASYLGTLLASFVLPIWLFSMTDALSLAVLIAILNSGVAWLTFWKTSETRLVRKLMILSLGPLIFVGHQHWGEQARQNFLKLIYLDLQLTGYSWSDLKIVPPLLRSVPPVRRISTPYQDIDLVRFKGATGRWDQFLFLNSAIQFSDRTERVYHESMAHGSISMMNSVPRNILVLGGGDGLLVRELLRYGDQVGSITLVELDEEMIRLANSRDGFLSMNQGSLQDPKVQVVIDDAFHNLRQSRERYDAVFIDFPFPDTSDLARLYSVEFYGLVLKALKPSGFAALDFPLFDLRRTTKSVQRPTRQDVLISTLHAAGVASWSAFGAIESFLVFTPDQRQLELSPDRSGSLISESTLQNLVPLTHEQLLLEVRDENVNSIFKPRIPQRRGR